MIESMYVCFGWIWINSVSGLISHKFSQETFGHHQARWIMLSTNNGPSVRFRFWFRVIAFAIEKVPIKPWPWGGRCWFLLKGGADHFLVLLCEWKSICYLIKPDWIVWDSLLDWILQNIGRFLSALPAHLVVRYKPDVVGWKLYTWFSPIL